VVLIIDVFGLALRARVISESRDQQVLQSKPSPQDASQETQTLLLFAGRRDSRMAVPLSQVARLEEFPCTALEQSTDWELVQYRDGILPLVTIEDLLAERRSRPRAFKRKTSKTDSIQTIVYSRDGDSVGLVVEEIIDTIEHSMRDLRPASRKGVMASAVIQGRFTEILDLEAICTDFPRKILTGART
jgi:two-component system chemotaxis sensor kinase CheA